MTAHDEETQRGGLRGAVDELFGRGERTDSHAEGDHRDEHLHDDTAHRDDAYAVEPGLDREQGTAEYGDAQTQHGDTQTQSEYSGDPAQHGATQTPYGDDVRSETVTPEQVQHGGDATAEGQFQHGGDVRTDDTAVAEHSSTADRSGTGYADDASHTDPAFDQSAVATDSVNTDARTRDAVPAASTATATTPSQHAASAGSADLAAAHDSDEEGRAALVTSDRAESYGSRWNDVKGEFVDEPRRAVADADALVGELLDELQELFKAQRADIEHSLDADETSTEDLRLALRRYRSFFDRLLSI
jgi:hypothetical protein